MKLTLLLLFITAMLPLSLVAQNVGVGTTEPMNKLQLHGNLLVTTPTTATITAPTVSQTKTLVNATTITFLNTDSTGRVYDPGGPAGNYLANMTANATIPASLNMGIEVTAETMELGLGDSLIIKESSVSTSNLLAVGNGYTTTGKWVFNSSSLYIIFKSNADATTGIGFSLLFKRLYNNSTSLPDISGATGSVLFFDVKNASFRSGLLNNSVRGNYSTAMGYSTAAIGVGSTAMGWSTEATDFYATAMGYFTIASGGYSTAMGHSTVASGAWSTAIGAGTIASGDRSTAMGNSTTASGFRSTAVGFNATASGDHSTAMGNYVSTNNQDGCFTIGDNSTTTVMNSPAANNFRARFDNGYRFYTSADYSTSCSLGAGANAWSTTSDMRLKENFEELNGEDFLKKIAAMRLVSWNYKKQDPSKFRHYGPMAQDFYAAFGKDKYGNIGNDTTINQADFDGVNLIAIQALEKRTAEQQHIIVELKKDNADLRGMILQVRKEMDALLKKQN
jgi:hypothetical protein